MILVLPLSARFSLGRWGFGRIGWVMGQDGGTYQIKVNPTRPMSPTTIVALYRSSSVRSGLGRSGSINSALDHSDTREIIGGGNKRGAKRNRLKRTEDTSAVDGCCGGQCVIL